MKTRFNKVTRDLTGDYRKNMLLVFAIAIGVFGIGTILGSYSVIKREMAQNYASTHPASATIEIDGGLSKEIVNEIKMHPGVKLAERHATIIARMQVGIRWYPILLFVIDDYKNKKTNKPGYVSGAREPVEGTILVERSAYTMMEEKEGGEIIVKTSNGLPTKIRITGTVHDPGLAPAWQEQAGYGYITMSTLSLLGETPNFDQLRIAVNRDTLSRDHISRVAQEVASLLEKNKYEVHEIQVPPPGKHPHQSQMSAVMNIFIIFSFLVLILGSILVSTSMGTLMLKEIRQIAVMKTVGARTSQITVIYFTMVLILCLLAVAITIPASQLVASAFSEQLARLLNLEIRNSTIPLWVPLVQTGSGILIPLIAASVPVLRGSRISIKKALDHYGANQNPGTGRWITTLSGYISNRIVTLAVRNVFRQRSRLLMTLGLLAAGGAMFMTALNVSEAWKNNLSRIYTQRGYDLEVRLSDGIEDTSILYKIKLIDGVTIVEGWSFASTSIADTGKFEITQTYPDKGHGSFSVQAMPIPTKLLSPEVVEGRWLNSPLANELVLNQSSRRGYRLGDQIALMIDDKPTHWEIVGFTEDVGSPALAYVSIDAFARIAPANKGFRMLRIAYAERSKEYAYRKNKEVEELLEKEHISVSSIIPVWVLRNAIAAHMKVLVNSLIAMSIMMASVGILGLMSTMSMNVIERTREIGVMRTIGATPSKVNKLIVLEGLIIGGMSLFGAVALSLVLSTYLGRVIGDMAFRTPLTLSVSWPALIGWIILVGMGSYVATLRPARRANKITIRQALSFE